MTRPARLMAYRKRPGKWCSPRRSILAPTARDPVGTSICAVYSRALLRLRGTWRRTGSSRAEKPTRYASPTTATARPILAGPQNCT